MTLACRSTEALTLPGVLQNPVPAEALSMLRVLEARGLAVTEAQRSRVLREGYAATLYRWLVGALTPETTESLLGAP